MEKRFRLVKVASVIGAIACVALTLIGVRYWQQSALERRILNIQYTVYPNVPRDPMLIDSLLVRARSEMEVGDLLTARDCLDAVTGYDERNLSAYYYLALCYSRLGASCRVSQDTNIWINHMVLIYAQKVVELAQADLPPDVRALAADVYLPGLVAILSPREGSPEVSTLVTKIKDLSSELDHQRRDAR